LALIVNAKDFNQHSIGRALSILFEAGVSELYSGFALKAMDILELKVNSTHLDATSFFQWPLFSTRVFTFTCQRWGF
jgi:hypothetical protein